MIHVMSSLREQRRAETRAAIVDAFLDLSHAGNDPISMPDVADRAGVSVRTLYRHFETRSELQTAAANHFNDRVRTRLDAEATVENFSQYLTELWTDFRLELPAVTAEHATAAGRELRATRLPSSRATIRRALSDVRGIDVDDELVDLIIALTSSSMFLELVDRMGHEPKDAVAMVTRTIEPLLAQTLPDQTPPPDSPRKTER
jgi:AcrR family transcriptional regulator